MRHSMANEKKFKKGPNTRESGSTHPSVSARIIEDEATAPAVDSEANAPNPISLAKVRPTTSTGDASREEFIMNGAVEVGAVKIGTARQSCCTGANATQDRTAASSVAMFSKMAMTAAQVICPDSPRLV